jgi:hypothetical protein
MAYRLDKTTDEQGRPVDGDGDDSRPEDPPESAAENVLREKYGGSEDGGDGEDDADSASESVIRDRYGRFASQGE